MHRLATRWVPGTVTGTSIKYPTSAGVRMIRGTQILQYACDKKALEVLKFYCHVFWTREHPVLCPAGLLRVYCVSVGFNFFNIKREWTFKFSTPAYQLWRTICINTVHQKTVSTTRKPFASNRKTVSLVKKPLTTEIVIGGWCQITRRLNWLHERPALKVIFVCQRRLPAKSLGMSKVLYEIESRVLTKCLPGIL
jgi:hypothetical protein